MTYCSSGPHISYFFEVTSEMMRSDDSKVQFASAVYELNF